MDHPPLAVQHMGIRVRRIPGRRSGRRLGRTPAVPRAVRRGRRRNARRGRSPGQHCDDHCGVYGQARGGGDPVTARLLHRGCRSLAGVRCGHRVTELEQSQADRQSHPPNTDDPPPRARHSSWFDDDEPGRRCRRHQRGSKRCRPEPPPGAEYHVWRTNSAASRKLDSFRTDRER
jgi:hypothetical protein